MAGLMFVLFAIMPTPFLGCTHPPVQLEPVIPEHELDYQLHLVPMSRVNGAFKHVGACVCALTCSHHHGWFLGIWTNLPLAASTL
jgi:hypothetical protein